MVSIFTIWFVAYCLPATIGTVVLKTMSKYQIFSNVFIHIMLLCSVIISSYVLQTMNVPFTIISIDVYLYIMVIVLLAITIKATTLLYAASTVIQELSMLLIATIIMSEKALWVALLLIVPWYCLAHNAHKKAVTMVIIACWGIFSIVLFSYTQLFWINCTLHFIGGMILIKKGFIYQKS